MHALQYLFSGRGTYLFDFQSVSTRYHQFLLKRIILMFFKELDSRNALENDNYVLILEKMYWAGFRNISGNPLKKVTYKNGAKFP